MGFRVCSCNMGSDFNDYYNLCQYVEPSFLINSEGQQEQFKAKYGDIQKQVAARLKDQAEVFFLQEAVELGRPLIVALQERHFQIFKTNEKFSDCMIALSSNFQNVENHSKLLDGGDVAIANAVHKPSGQAFTFVSAHVPHCSLEGVVDPDDASTGDHYCRQMAETLHQIGPSTVQLIGADMNANPEKWLPRFTTLTEKGFEIHRTRGPTNVKPQSQTYKERELDFFFTRTPPQKGLFSGITSLWKAQKVQMLTDQPLGWKSDRNASDHVPIFAHVVT